MNFLRDVTLFADLSFKILRTVYYMCEIITVSYNQIIYKEEDESDYFYIIKSGQFLVILNLNKCYIFSTLGE